MANIYHVHIPDGVDYGEYEGFVVIARNETHAQQLICEYILEEDGWYIDPATGKLEDYPQPAWFTAQHVLTCIGTTRQSCRVVMENFHNG